MTDSDQPDTHLIDPIDSPEVTPPDQDATQNSDTVAVLPPTSKFDPPGTSLNLSRRPNILNLCSSRLQCSTTSEESFR